MKILKIHPYDQSIPVVADLYDQDEENISGVKEDFDKQNPKDIIPTEPLVDAVQADFITIMIEEYFDKIKRDKFELHNRIVLNFKNVLGIETTNNIEHVISKLDVNTLSVDQYNQIKDYHMEYVQQFNRTAMLEKLSKAEWGKRTDVNNEVIAFNEYGVDKLIDAYIANDQDKNYFRGKKSVLKSYAHDFTRLPQLQTKIQGLVQGEMNKKFIKASNLTLCLFIFYKYVLSQQKADGSGMFNIKKAKVKGTGVTKELKKSYHKPIHKFYIDSNKLNKIRYIFNKHLSDVQPLVMKPQFKKCFNQLMNHGDIDMKDYELLSKTDKELIKKLIKMFNLDVQIDDDNNSFANNFEILKGQFRAGNNSQELKDQLKEYIMHAVNTSVITRTMGKNLMVEMGI